MRNRNRAGWDRVGLLADLETMGAAPERRRCSADLETARWRSGWRQAPWQGRGAGDGARRARAVRRLRAPSRAPTTGPCRGCSHSADSLVIVWGYRYLITQFAVGTRVLC